MCPKNPVVIIKLTIETGGQVMDKKRMISDAAKEVGVESHVLRYWEEELKLLRHTTMFGSLYLMPLEWA